MKQPKTYTTLPDYIWEKGRVKGAPYIQVILKSDFDLFKRELIEKLEAKEKRGILEFTKDCHCIAEECRFKNNLLEGLKKK